MRRFHALSILLTVMLVFASESVVMAQEDAECHPNGSGLSVTEELQIERIVRMQAALVAGAAEAFAADHQGVYPSRAESLLTYLPGRVALENPFVPSHHSPQNGVAVDRGEIGYQPRCSRCYPFVADGYVVTGFGKVALLITIDSESRDDETGAKARR